MLKINFPMELPVSQRVQEIEAAIKDNQVVIVAGETGSGKTTQLPKLLLKMGYQNIAHTQPRRIAARSVSERISSELGSNLGDTVGFQVRFTDRVSATTKLRVVTDGILLAQIHRDKQLKAYDAIIIDEAHERSLNIDFLLGYLKRLLPTRPDLRVIITSATIDPESFAQHFSINPNKPVPIIEVSGRTYPVEIRYQEIGKSDQLEVLGSVIKSLTREGPGDMLVFFSGESEIRDAAESLRFLTVGGATKLEILPLYGRLSNAEQQAVFKKAKPGFRKVILATNVAETSLTVPGIGYVIDFGYARISRWSPRSKVQRLPIEAISQASANQRSGRAGRVSSGVCVRLYSEEDFLSRPEFTEPEILRTGLASVILQMLSLGIGDIQRFPFLTPPDKRGVSAGMALLAELRAVQGNKITKIGRELARLPIEPRFGRMILAAQEFNALNTVIILVAGLTIQDVRERPREEAAKADMAHARFKDPKGDLMTLLNLWNYIVEKRTELSGNAFRKLCKNEYLNYLRVREWADLVRQLTVTAKSFLNKDVFVDDPQLTSFEAVHRSVLAGLLSQLGIRDDTVKKEPGKRFAQEFYGSRGIKFVIHPASVLAKKPPEMVMAVELVETSRLFARQVAVLDHTWVEHAAGNLVKSQIFEPHWSKKQGSAVAYEKVLLFGIPIVDKRTVQLSRFDKEHARELFIRHALVLGEWNTNESFDRANWQLRRELLAIEDRERRRDVSPHDDVIFDFYAERIPETVLNERQFEAWWKNERTKNPKLLHLGRADLLDLEADQEADTSFPRIWSFGDQQLKLKYRFDPAASDDGVSVIVPLPLLPRVADTDVASLVPGMRLEYTAALIKSLPKNIRKHVVPAASWAEKLTAEITPQLRDDPRVKYHELLAKAIQRYSGQIVKPEDFDLTKIPEHLTPSFQVVDSRGKKIGTSRDLMKLQKELSEHATKTVTKIADRDKTTDIVTQKNIVTWSFGDLARYQDSGFDSRGSAGKVRAYPCLIDRKTHVDLSVVSTPEEQARLHPQGVTRLLLLSSPATHSYIQEHLTNDEKLLIASGPFLSLTDAISEVLTLLAKNSISSQRRDGLIFQKSDFDKASNEFAKASVTQVYEIFDLLKAILSAAKSARSALDKISQIAYLRPLNDIKKQYSQLIHKSFVSKTQLEQLSRYPTYLKAISLRIEKLLEKPGNDQKAQNEIEEVLKAFEAAGGTIPLAPGSTENISSARWLIEEFRVSLFAQQLGTRETVSKKRILKLF